jgi:MoxR-like ATPase
MTGTPPDVDRVADAYRTAETTIGRVIVGQESAVRLAFTTLLCGGHSLLEGVPGVGKTLLVQTIATALGVRFGRIQFTPDLMPSDIIGTAVLDPRERETQFRPGPLFTDLLLADEINRASAKSQAALL